MFRNGFDGRILWLKTFNKEGNKGNKALVNPYVQNTSNTYFMSSSRSNLMTWNWHDGTFQLHLCFFLPPSLTLQHGVAGRWKPNHSNLTPVDIRSPPNWWIYVSRLDQSMYRRQMRYPNLKHLTSPDTMKKGVECGCMKFRFIALSTWWTEIANFFSEVFRIKG